MRIEKYLPLNEFFEKGLVLRLEVPEGWEDRHERFVPRHHESSGDQHFRDLQLITPIVSGTPK